MKIEWNPQDPGLQLVIESREKFISDHPDLYAQTIMGRFHEPEKFCRMIRCQNVLSGNFVVPRRQHPIKDQVVFSFALEGKDLYFIGDCKKIEPMITEYRSQYDLDYQTSVGFLVGFMNYMIREDVYFLEDYDIRLQKLEEDIYLKKKVPMEAFIMTTRRDMDILNNYYIQLNAMGETLQGEVAAMGSEKLSAEVSLYLARIQSLLSIVSTIKGYTEEIWNLRQTQLSDQQNKISTLLTIITTIFLPLTLVTGWYGMNFDNMPMIHSPNGYYIIVVLCIVIIVCECLYLKRKRWITFHDQDPQ